MVKNTDEEISKVLTLLNCNYSVAYKDLEIYRYVDLNDKELQYSMLDNESRLIYFRDYYSIKKLLKEIRKDFKYIIINKIRKKKKEKIIDTYADFENKLNEFLIKHIDHHNINQYNIGNYINDSYELEKELKKYIEFRDTHIISRYIIPI